MSPDLDSNVTLIGAQRSVASPFSSRAPPTSRRWEKPQKPKYRNLWCELNKTFVTLAEICVVWDPMSRHEKLMEKIRLLVLNSRKRKFWVNNNNKRRRRRVEVVSQCFYLFTAKLRIKFRPQKRDQLDSKSLTVFQRSDDKSKRLLCSKQQKVNHFIFFGLNTTSMRHFCHRLNDFWVVEKILSSFIVRDLCDSSYMINTSKCFYTVSDLRIRILIKYIYVYIYILCLYDGSLYPSGSTSSTWQEQTSFWINDLRLDQRGHWWISVLVFCYSRSHVLVWMPWSWCHMLKCSEFNWIEMWPDLCSVRPDGSDKDSPSVPVSFILIIHKC